MENVPEFKATVEISRKWDGNEVAEEIVNKIKNKNLNPKFILLFTTIHYKNEFEKILTGIKNGFQNSLLIGSTIAGFITSEGCFTRGVTALSVDYPNMEISVGIGRNTKKNPEKAALDCTAMIKDQKKQETWKNKLLLDIISATTVPQMFGKRTSVFIGNLPTAVLAKMLEVSTRRFQLGAGNIEIILDKLVENFKDRYIFGIGANDNNKFVSNYQFYNGNVEKNSVICLSISTDKKLFFNENIGGLKPTGKTLRITDKKLDGLLITKINDRPANDEFFNIMGWDKDTINENTLFRKILYYPFVYKENGALHPEIFGLFLGKSIACGNLMRGDDAEIYSSSGKNILESFRNLLPEKADLSIILSCSMILETLGREIYKIKKTLDEHSTCYLLIFSGPEHFYNPENNVFMNRVISNQVISFI